MGPLLILVLACVSIVVRETVATDTKLLFVQMLFRHGQRTPLNQYPTDKNSADNFPEGYGQLDKTGKLQQYTVGKYLRDMYDDFITSNPTEVVVNSTEYDRCINSALSRLASLYETTKEFQFEEDVYWQPIPVHYKDSMKDKVLGMGSECPRAYAEKDRIADTQEFQASFAEFQEMLENVMQESDLHDWDSLIILQDTLTIEKRMGLKIPDWANHYYDELTRFSNLYVYSVFNSELMHVLRVGPLLEDIRNNMKRKLDGEIPHQKMQLYSAHDANIIVLLQTFNLYYARPPYCSTVVFELHELPDGQNAVRMFYLNSTHPEDEKTLVPMPLVLEDCTEYCPYDQFLDLTNHLIPEDWDEQCKLEGWKDWSGTAAMPTD